MSHLIEIPDYQQIAETFAGELAESAAGKQTSLPFLRTPLPNHHLLREGESCQIFVIGGTNGESASVKYHGGTFSVLSHEKFVLPKFETDMQFFQFLEKYTSSEVRAISLNFAYTLIPVVGELGELDGIMESGDTKGHAFIGLQKERVGKCVHEYFLRKGKDILVTVANDTICLLLSSLHQFQTKDRLVAGIVGTGYNLAIFLQEHLAVNLQASDFCNFSQTDSGKIVDGGSTNRGEQLYNKEVAAGELYKHFNIYVDLLQLPADKLSSTEDLGRLASANEGVASQVAQELFVRSASLVAAQLAGVYWFKGKPDRLDCVMEGSLFWKSMGYQGHILAALDSLGIPAGAIRFHAIQDSGIWGAIHLFTS